MDRLAAIEIYIRVVDTGSFSAAARHFDVGQPAVSKAVAQLEDWLGVKLLRRSTRSLTPTEAGQNFYLRAKRAVEEAGARWGGLLERDEVRSLRVYQLEEHLGLGLGLG